MNIRSLRIFQCVCQKGNITKAAQELFMTQPAISHAVQALEEEVGCALFDRIGKRIYVNEIGRTFLQKVNQVILSYEELEEGLPHLTKEVNIRMGSSITIANYWLPKALKSLQEVQPQVTTQVYIDSAEKVIAKLLSHELDVALVEGVVEHENLTTIPFAQFELLVVCSKQNSISNKKEITWEDVKQQTWLLREQGSATRDTFDSALQLQQIAINPSWTSVNSQALLQGVKQNLGVTILPDVLLSDHMMHEMSVHRIKSTRMKNVNHIVYMKGKVISTSINSLIEIVKAMQS